MTTEKSTPQKFTPEELTRLGPAAVEEAIRAEDAKVVREISTDPKNFQQVIQRTDAYGQGFNQGVAAQIIQEAGVVQLFHMQTGISSLPPMNLLPAKLRERDELNRLVWTTKQSEAATPIQPTHPCMLHKDHAMRPVADRMGFMVHNKKFFSFQDVLDHTKNRHQKAWAAFERDTIENEKAEERDYRRTSMAAITNAAMQSSSAQQQLIERACAECGESVFATNVESADIKLQVHMKIHGSTIPVSPHSETEPPLVSDEWLRETIGGPAGPAPSPEQELLLAKVQNFPGWCPVDGCDFVCDGKSKSGAMMSMRWHDKREHGDG